MSAPQQALADFLRLDPDLLAVAAEASPALTTAQDDPGELAQWLARLPPAEKDKLLLRVAQDQAAQVRMELMRRFRGEPKTEAAGDVQRRTVAQLLDNAAARRQERERRAAAERAEQESHRERERALAREKRLDELARDEDAAWSRAGAMIATKKPKEYDAAVELLKDLRAIAGRADRLDAFIRRFAVLHQDHLRKPSLIERFNRAGLNDPPSG
jgi:hypothetical protein